MSLMEPTLSDIKDTCGCSLWRPLEGTIERKELFKVDEQESWPEIQANELIIPLTAFPLSSMSRDPHSKVGLSGVSGESWVRVSRQNDINPSA